MKSLISALLLSFFAHGLSCADSAPFTEAVLHGGASGECEQPGVIPGIDNTQAQVSPKKAVTKKANTTEFQTGGFFVPVWFLSEADPSSPTGKRKVHAAIRVQAA